jgi:two-component system response regulator NreC
LGQRAQEVIQLALVDGQTIFREGLRALIEQEPDLEVVAHAASVTALEESDVEPDVVVTEIALPDAAHDEVIARLRRRFHDAAIVALTVLDDLPTVRQVLAAGADGYVLKSADTTELFAGVRAVARGDLYLQPSVGTAFASPQPVDRVETGEVDGLTPKELEVLKLLALGHTNAEIAALTGSSLRTIEAHRAHIQQKLDRHTRAELVRIAFDAGLLRL